ncbi:unnamed protein product [Rhodiola kirilowii]
MNSSDISNSGNVIHDSTLEGHGSSSSVSQTQSETLHCVPDCPDEITPKKGLTFNKLEYAVQFYESYARVAGFTVRLSTTKRNSDRTVTHKYLVCHRQGYNNDQAVVDTLHDSSNHTQRNRRVTRCGCKAKMAIKIGYGGRYRVYSFEEKHNHQLASKAGSSSLGPTVH